MAKNRHDLTGKRFGKVVVLERAPRRPGCDYSNWWVKCDCGVIGQKTRPKLTKTTTPACRACMSRARSERRTTHGETGTYLHNFWLGVVNACHGPNYQGGWRLKENGIEVSEPWRTDYQAFAAWVGENLGDQPEPWYTLNRIDLDGHFEPGNLRWFTPRELIGR